MSPENYNSRYAPGWRAAAAVTTVAEKARRGSAFWSGAAWSGGWVRAAGVAFKENCESVWHIPVGIPATMSSARESHPHGVKRSASPDDDVNNNG